MTLGTMDDKKTTAAVEQADGSHDSGGRKMSGVTRKHVIIGVTCAVVIGMVIAGVLVGFKFHLDSNSEIVTRTLEFKQNINEKVKEDVSADVKDNYVLYHVKDDDTEVSVIEDFNRGIQVIKVTRSEVSVCFISTLNTSDSALPTAVINATATDETLEQDDKYYEVSETPVKDKSMLGTHGQKLCDNLDVHWMIQTCHASMNDTMTSSKDNRQKRGFFTWLITTVVTILVKSCWRCYRCIFGQSDCKWKTCCQWYFTSTWEF